MTASPYLNESVQDTASTCEIVHADKMNRILHNVRVSLGMDFAFIAEFKGAYKHFRFVDHETADPPVRQGDVVAISDGYCQKVVLGHLPQMIPDTRLQPAALQIRETTSLPIGSHMSVPLRLSDGSIYGTLCCLSHLPDPTLNARELRMLQAIANLVASEIDAFSLFVNGRRAKSEAITAAIDAGEPCMVYQPLFRLADRTVLGAEALARFPGVPARSPVEWFSDAADCGLRSRLELAAMRNAVRDYGPVWAARPDALLAINLSARTLLDSDIAGAMADAPADRLIIEITEHDHIDNYAQLAIALAPLRARGMRVAVDDAGAGYASLHHVVSLSPDVIKLDISLTQGIDRDRTRTALASAILAFARQTGSLVVAEGIETPAELQALTRLGIDLGQGYLLGRPGPAHALTAAP